MGTSHQAPTLLQLAAGDGHLRSQGVAGEGVFQVLLHLLNDLHHLGVVHLVARRNLQTLVVGTLAAAAANGLETALFTLTALIAFLASKQAAPVVEASGLEPKVK